MELDVANPIRKITDKLEIWVNGFLSMLPNLVAALIVLTLFIFLTRFSRKFFFRISKRITHNTIIQNLVVNTLSIFILGFGIFIVLGILNLDKTVTSLLAGIGVVGLVLGFAFQDIASNFVAGLILATRTPFKINDIVEANGQMGVVLNTNLRFTTLLTFNGQEVYIPNKILINEVISNYSAEGVRRVELLVGVSYAEDLRKVQQISRKAIEGIEGVLKEKGIEPSFEAFADSSINFTLRFWINYPNNQEFLRLRSEAVIVLKEAFDQHNITIPFPIRTLDFGIKGGKTLAEMQDVKRTDD